MQSSLWEDALYGTYTVTLNALKTVMKPSIFSEENKPTKDRRKNATQEEGFQELRRRKRLCTEETAQTVRKTAVQAKTTRDVNSSLSKEVATRNFFPPSKRRKWPWIIPVPKHCHVRRQLLEKQVGRPK
jgi:hypothetical protein